MYCQIQYGLEIESFFERIVRKITDSFDVKQTRPVVAVQWLQFGNFFWSELEVEDLDVGSDPVLTDALRNHYHSSLGLNNSKELGYFGVFFGFNHN